MQHGPVDDASLVPMLQAISTTDTVPSCECRGTTRPHHAGSSTPGATAVICPMVNTREQAEAFIAACRYPPAGTAATDPTGRALYGGEDYTDYANETVDNDGHDRDARSAR